MMFEIMKVYFYFPWWLENVFVPILHTELAISGG